ncbi:hypothetical protein LIER_34488 [Lithospermum erythrorhizon]|uniref:RNase H type-1 domain-containing protein n=1 Tax=Lithospermum erythrorhizon TaxID=34254 RepID=A0AAV3S2I4_LITER
MGTWDGACCRLLKNEPHSPCTTCFVSEQLLHHVDSPLVAEALDLREALNFAIRYGYGKVEGESDSMQIVRSVNGQQKVPLEIDIIEYDIHHFAKYLEVIFQTRQSNNVTHCIAHWNHRGSMLPGFWIHLVG